MPLKVIGFLTLLCASWMSGLSAEEPAEFQAWSPAQLMWSTATTGISKARLYGAADQAGPFAYRVRVPAGFVAPMHFHSADLNSTIISGAVEFQSSDQRPPVTITANGFVFVPAGLSHREVALTATEMEVRGIGPSVTRAIEFRADPAPGPEMKTDEKNP